MNLKHNADRSSRFLLRLPALVAFALLASTTATADEELAAAAAQPSRPDLGGVLGPDAARQIHQDAAVAQAALAAELRTGLAATAKPRLDDPEAFVNDETGHSDESEPAPVSASASGATRGGAVQSRATIEHTRVFMLVRGQRAQQGVLVQ